MTGAIGANCPSLVVGHCDDDTLVCGAAIHVSQGAEAVVLELKNEVGVIERLSRSGQGHRLELRQPHTAIIV